MVALWKCQKWGKEYTLDGKLVCHILIHRLACCWDLKGNQNTWRKRPKNMVVGGVATLIFSQVWVSVCTWCLVIDQHPILPHVQCSLDRVWLHRDPGKDKVSTEDKRIHTVGSHLMGFNVPRVTPKDIHSYIFQVGAPWIFNEAPCSTLLENLCGSMSVHGDLILLHELPLITVGFKWDSHGHL